MKIRDLIFKIDDRSFEQILEYLVKKASERDLSSGRQGKKTFVVTLNPEIIMLAMKDGEFEKVLKSSDLALNDGIGVTWAGKIFGKSFNGRVTGTDLVEKLAEKASRYPITVAFLGGRGNVAEKSAECLKSKFPGLRVAFAREEVGEVSNVSRVSKGETKTPPDTSGTFGTFDTLSCDILFVAFGAPKQEKWIYENLPKIDVKVAIGVGGAFDFISGRVRRAPVLVRSLGLEWLFRLLIQPWRWKRQTALIKFVMLVLRERLI